MEDSILPSYDSPTNVKSRFPSRDFFTPDSIKQEKRERDAKIQLENSNVVVITDTDADGLACGALIEEQYEDIALIPAGYHGGMELLDAINVCTDNMWENSVVYICDIGIDEWEKFEQPVRKLVDRAEEVHWFDHHTWEEDVREVCRNHGVDLHIGGEDMCAADVTLKNLDGDTSPRLEEVTGITRDHDLWIKEDPRSDDLSDLSHWMDNEEYMQYLQTHGPELSEDAKDLLERKREEKYNLINHALSNVETFDISNFSVAVTYGRCSQNEVAEALREKGHDLVITIKPSGAVSLRGSNDFQRCHEVARRLRGGGHPMAAGCYPVKFDSMTDLVNHWTTKGYRVREVVLTELKNTLHPNKGENNASTEKI